MLRNSALLSTAVIYISARVVSRDPGAPETLRFRVNSPTVSVITVNRIFHKFRIGSQMELPLGGDIWRIEDCLVGYPLLILVVGGHWDIQPLIRSSESPERDQLAD